MPVTFFIVAWSLGFSVVAVLDAKPRPKVAAKASVIKSVLFMCGSIVQRDTGSSLFLPDPGIGQEHNAERNESWS